MKVKIAESWKNILQPEFQKEYFHNLVKFVKKEYLEHQVFPPGKEIFSAFDYCSFEELKIVILGQDPYHGYLQAHGLCFSVREGMPMPPSLLNIFKEIKEDMKIDLPLNGCLERWAKQGILLLNATLTVRANSPGSHQNKGWETFTDAVIKHISDRKEGMIFFLWGAYAQKKGFFINKNKHLVLESAHPSPFSAHRGFFGNRHFSKANEYLRSRGKDEIDW